jgi:superfamily II DNA/RNA helicase
MARLRQARSPPGRTHWIGRFAHSLAADMTTDSTAPTFADLGVPQRLVETLAAQGIDRPFSIQTLSLPDALAGRDVCGKAKTGSGKTLAFGIPMLARLGKAAPKRPRGLVLVPTRELALQVTSVLEPLGASVDRSVVAVYGGASTEQQVKALEKGGDLVIATPGRLIDLVDTEGVSLGDIEVLALDEADRMVDMGFLPQVEWLLRRSPKDRQTLLFSATLDGAIDHLVASEQRDPVRHEVVSTQMTVDEMVHRFLLVHQMDKARVAAALIRTHPKVLLFTRTKRGADRLVDDLDAIGVRASAIHGDLRQKDRERALAEFTDGRLGALVATDVAARGIHVDEIGLVVHFDPPDDPKNYLHRSGRTARAGESGIVVTLALWNEELDVRRLQKRLGLNVPIVEMFSNDSRLTDLAGWTPSAAEGVGARVAG